MRHVLYVAKMLTNVNYYYYYLFLFYDVHDAAVNITAGRTSSIVSV